MLESLYVLMLCWLVFSPVDTQPLSCKGDEHCSEGYYCDIEAHICQQCLRCQNLNRMIPKHQDLNNTCVKACGPCFEGFVNIFTNNVKGKCVSSDLLQYSSEIYCIYIWMTVLGMGLVIVIVVFIDIIRTTALHDPQTPEGEMSTEGVAAA